MVIVKRFRLQLATLWLITCVHLAAQQYTIESFRQAQGLGNLSVIDLAFDKSGFLWVATDNGLYRLLGSRLERIGAEQGLTERGVKAVYVDSRGRVWAGTAGNLFLWDGARFRAVSKRAIEVYAPHRILEGSGNRLLVVDDLQLVELALDADGNAISSTPFFSEQQRLKLPALNSIGAVARGADGTLWLGCDEGLCSYRNGRVTMWDSGDGAEWLNLYIDRNGTVWAASKNRLVALAQGAARFVDRTPPGIDSRVFHWSPIVEDKQGRILAASGQGVARWDGIIWQSIRTENGFVNNRITGLAVDRDGDPWMGTLSSGLFHWIGYEHWEGWSDAQGLPSSIIWSIKPEDTGKVLVGTVNGAAEIDAAQRKVSVLTGNAPWTYGQIGGIEKDRKGHMWVGTFAGEIMHIVPNSAGVMEVGRVASLGVFIRRMEIDRDGRLWIITNDGIFTVDRPEDSSVVHRVYEADAVLDDSKQILSMSTSVPPSGQPNNGDMYFLQAHGLLHYGSGHWSKVRVRGLPASGAILKHLSFAPDGSLCVLGLDETRHIALWHLVRDGEGFDANIFALPPNLRESLPMGLLIDSRGWVWMTTDNGVSGWNGSLWRTFNQESGLIWNDTDAGVLAEASDGSIWVGTAGGAAHLLDPARAFDEVPLSVAVTSLERGGQRMIAGASLPWQSLPVQVSFAAPPAWNRSSLVFSYRVKDDSAWIQTQDAQATFADLPPGRYRFNVFAFSPELAASSAIASVDFTLLPPWWRTIWADLVYAIAALLLIWWFLSLRTRQLTRKREELESLVRERTQALELSQESLRMQATHDALTGLLNRATILAHLDEEMERARRDRTILAVLMADVDHFKWVNDTYGHIAGDAVLRSFANGLHGSVRKYDLVGRYGGEEFLLILGNLCGDEIAERLSTLHTRISNVEVSYETHQLVVTCSVGVSVLLLGDSVTDAKTMLSNADAALYRAKGAGRNRVVVAGGTLMASPLDPSEKAPFLM